MARFCFFTDPAKLKAQQPSQAFGAMSPADGNDRYRITDVHTASGTAPVVAICDGLLCAQRDASGTLSLILKPLEQPPFDFPAIAYFIYKGVDPASLLAGAFVDVSKAAGNGLVRQIEAAWLAPVNGNSGDPPERCLGLHLTPSSTAADFPDLDLGLYADAEPLDNLFYRGDAEFQLPLVRGGWRLGDFSASGPFGLEILADTAAYAPRIRLARRVENRIEVPSLDASVAHEPNEAAYFMHWHAKEEALHFIDPCAFWGSFYDRKLKVVDAGGATTRKKGKAIYDDLLRGAYDDAALNSGLFYNRNRIYLDIRNEHHRSFNYYKINGAEICATFDTSAALDTCNLPYSTGGWPIFSFDQALLGASGSGGAARLRLAFRTNGYASLTLYKPQEKLARSTTAVSRQQVRLDLRTMSVSPAVAISFPLSGSGPYRTMARWLFMSARFDEQTVPTRLYGATATYPWEMPPGIPLPAVEIPFGTASSSVMKTYPDPYVLQMPYLTKWPILYNSGWMAGGGQAVLFLTPSGPLGREIGPRSPALSLDLPNGNLVDAINQLIRPRKAVLRQPISAPPTLDHSLPDRAKGVATSGNSQAVICLSAQALTGIVNAQAPAVALMTLAATPTPGNSQRLSLTLHGLREKNGFITAFAQPLDLMATSNADAH